MVLVMKVIQLEFIKCETRLAGFPYGEATFNEQVKNKIQDSDFVDGGIKIVFPNQIEKVASSFVQGFFSELINTMGYSEIERCFLIETNDEKLTKRIKENIY